MAEELASALRRAHAYLGEDSAVLERCVDEAKAAFDACSADEVPAALAAVFDESEGLIAVACASGAARKRAFMALSGVLERAAGCGEAARYAQPVLAFCWHVVKTEVSDQAARAQALQLAAGLLSAGEAPLPAGVVATLRLPAWAKDARSRLFGVDARSPGGVRAGLLVLLGALAARYADDCDGEETAEEPLPAWLRARALGELQRQADLDAKKHEGLVVAAALDALSGALDATPPGALSPFEAKSAMGHALTACESAMDAKRFDTALAGLRLLGQQAGRHLRVALLETVVRSVDAVLACRRKAHAGVKEAAWLAVEALFDALSEALCDPQAGTLDLRRAAYHTAWHSAERLLQDKEAGERAACMALRAMGALAPAAVCCSDEPLAELARLAQALRRFSGLSAPEDHRALSAGFARVLALLDAYTRLVGALTTAAAGASDLASQDEGDAATGVMVDNASWVVRRYPSLTPRQRAEVRAALQRFLLALARGATAQPQRLLGQLALAWLTCALETHVTGGEGAGAVDMNAGADALVAGQPLWPRHVELWVALLAAPEGAGGALFDALAAHALRLVADTLDLRVRRVAAGGDAGAAAAEEQEQDLGEGLVAVNGEDVATFASLGEFLAALLPSVADAQLSRWAGPLAMALLDASRASPAIPTCYSLLSALLSCAAACEEEPQLVTSLRDFVAECGARAQAEQGDLQTALLRLVLAAPPSLAPPAVVAPAAAAALRLGVSLPALAAAALSALERLQDAAPDALAAHLAQVIPPMAPLLEEAARQEASGTSRAGEAALAATQAAAAAAPRGRNTAARAARAAQRGAAAAREGLSASEDVVATALRAQALLGRFGGAAHALVSGLEASSGAQEEEAGRWDPEAPRISLRLGLSAVTQTELFLDAILPRAARLAQSSPDRRTKIAACEFLHAVAVLLIGREARARASSNAAAAARTTSRAADAAPAADLSLCMAVVFSRLFPCLLALAVDPEPIACQLFLPLTQQLARWLGRTATRDAADKVAFLEALFEGSADRGSGALRKHCASLVALFVQWALKDAPVTAIQPAEAAEDVLRRCFAAMAHPCPWRRRGGAAALARVAAHLFYIDERGTKAPLPLAVTYALPALRRCIDSLARSAADPFGCGAAEATRVASRCFGRVAESQAGGTLRGDLPRFCLDLWLLTAARELPARAEAQRLFCDLVPRIAGGADGSLRGWLDSQDDGNAFAAHFCAPPPPPPAASPAARVLWCTAVDATLQWAAWALERRIVMAHELATARSSTAADNLPPVAAAEALLMLLTEPEPPASPSLASASLRMLLLVATDLMLAGSGDAPVTACLCATSDAQARMATLLTFALFRPAAMGVGADRPATNRELAATAARLLACSLAPGAPLAARPLAAALRERMHAMLLPGAAFSLAVVDMDLRAQGTPAVATTLLDGFDALAEEGLLPQLLPYSGPYAHNNLAALLAATAAALPEDAPPGLTLIGRRMLALARRLGLPAAALVPLLMDAARGALFFDRFQDVVKEQLAENEPAEAIRLLFDAIGTGCADLVARAAHVAEAVLDGARVSAQLHREAPPPQLRALLEGLAVHLPALQARLLAPRGAAAAVAAHRLLLGLLGRALDLDALCSANLLLAPSNPGCTATVSAFAALLRPLETQASAEAGVSVPSGRRHDSSVAVEALPLLPHFLALPADALAPVFDAMRALVQACVPLRGLAALARDNPVRPHYLSLRKALLDALAAVARRGAAHAARECVRACANMFFWDAREPAVVAASKALAAAVWAGPPASRDDTASALCEEAMTQLTERHTRSAFPGAALDAILRPVLRAAPPSFLEKFWRAHLKTLLRLADERATGSAGGGAALSGIAASADSVAAPVEGDVFAAKRGAVYGLVQIVHECCPPAGLERAKKEWTSGNLNGAWTKALTRELQEEGARVPQAALSPGAPLSDAELGGMARALAQRGTRAAAFAALAALLAATQSAEAKPPGQPGEPPGPSNLETWVGRLLGGEFFAGNSWAAVVDCVTPVKCALEVTVEAPRRRGGSAGRRDPQASLSRSLRAQASVGTSLSSSLSLEDASPAATAITQADAMQLDAPDGAAAAATAPEDAADEEPYEAAERADLLDRGPALDALVRLLEHCARAFDEQTRALALQGDLALPAWLAPLARALAGEAPLAPPSAALFVAKALLRLHGRFKEAEELRAARRLATAARSSGGASASSLTASLAASMDATLRHENDVFANMVGGVAAATGGRLQRSLARRGRPLYSLPARFAPLLAPPLINLLVQGAGGRSLHDVLRQAVWFLLDLDSLWSLAAAQTQPALGDALGRLLDHLVCVADAGRGHGVATKVNIELVQLTLRRAAPCWRRLVATHPSRDSIAEALTVRAGDLDSDAVNKRHAALQLLAAVMAPYETLLAQPLAFTEEQAAKLAERIVKCDIPDASPGRAGVVGHKRLYTSAGLVLGLELKRRAEAGLGPAPWETALWAKLRALCVAAVDPFICTLAAIADNYPQAACMQDMRLALTSQLTRTTGDVRWTALEALAVGAMHGSREQLWTELKPRLSDLASLASDDGALERLLRLLSPLLLRPWPAGGDGGPQAAAAHAAPILHASLLRHRAPAVRAAHTRLLVDLCAAFGALATLECVRLPLLAGLTDTDLVVREQCLSFWDAALPRAFAPRLLATLRDAYAAPLAPEWPRAATALLLLLPTHNAPLLVEPLLGDSPLDASAQLSEARIDTRWALGASLLGAALSLVPGGGSLGWGATQAAGGATQQPGAGVDFEASLSSALTATQETAPEWLRRSLAQPAPATTAAVAASAEDDSAAAQPPRDGAVRPSRRLIKALGGGPGKGISSADVRAAKLRAAAADAGHSVSLLRDYRIGDFPDIRVSRGDIIHPLAALAARDTGVAAAALAALAAGAWREPPLPGAPGVHAELRDTLARMLGEAAPEAALIAALHAIALADDRQAGVATRIHAQSVGRLAAEAGQLAGGTLLVETALLYGGGGASDGSATAPPKRRRLDSAAAAAAAAGGAAARDACEALSDLLRLGGDDFVALEVLTWGASAAAEHGPHLDALRAQLDGDERGAAAAFADVIRDAEEEECGEGGERVPPAELTRWRRDRIALLERMGDWEEACSDAAAQVHQLGGLDCAWRAGPQQRCWVGTLVRAAVRLPEQRHALAAAECVAEPAFRAAFSLELAQLEAAKTPPAEDAAARLLAAAARAGRAAWAAAPPGAERMRHAIVASWQPPAELGEALRAVRELRRVAAERGAPDPATAAAALRVLAPWPRRWPSRAHAPRCVLEAVASGREVCAQALAAAGADAAALTPLRAGLMRAAGDAARRCGAFDLAETLLAPCEAAQKSGAAPYDFAVVTSLLKIRIAQADAAAEDALAPEARVELLNSPLRILRLTLQKRAADFGPRPDWLRAAHALRGELCARLAHATGDAALATEALEALRCASALQGQLTHADAAPPDGRGASPDARRAARSLQRLALYLDDALAQQEDAAAAAPLSATAVVAAAGGADAAAALIASSILRANSLAGARLPSARGALPRVLSLLGRHPGARASFAQHGASVPPWLLLPWAPQMLAFLGGPEAPTLLPTLRQLALAYPRAMHAPVALAAEGDGEAAAAARAHLSDLVASRATAGFALGVEDLTFPHIRFAKWVSTLDALTLRVASEEAPRERAMRALRAMAADVADVACAKARGAGPVNLSFAKAAQPLLQARFGAPPHFPLLRWDSARAEIAALRKEVEAAEACSPQACSRLKAQTRRRLETLSESLASMSSAAAASPFDWVERPGQYAEAEARGCPPEPQRHARVVGCDPTVRVMASLMAPCVLTLRCDDGTEARFLAKGGEDLRQDERIQRLFRACAAALAAHGPSAARGLHVVTFHVEPLSPRCGLIAWLPRAAPLLDLLRGSMPLGAEEACEAAHVAFVNRWAGTTDAASSGRPYARLAMLPEAQLPAATVIAHLADLHARLPAYALRDALLARARSPEAFLAARGRYVATAVASSAACYIAGVGDRHPANIMVDGASGAVIHIDFGMAFGLGLTLPAPELVPFRLTRTLARAVAPYDRTELLVHDLGSALGALHAARAALVAALDVFSREPLLDWARDAHRQGEAQEAFVGNRLSVVRRKLSMANPVSVVMHELPPKYAQNANGWEAMQALLRGDAARGNVRAEVCARGGQDCASTLEQAACLVDMATDANILGRCWRGWRPWL